MAEDAERATEWAEMEARLKSDISRFADQASEKARAEAEERARVTVRVRKNAANSAVEGDENKIRSGAETEGAEIER